MTGAGDLYETIGATYTATRQEDPRVAAAVRDALGGAATILNVGAGAGSYEPSDRTVVAVEPSPTMVAQRRGRSALVAQAVAEALPFPDGAFDAAMAVLTVHHWGDRGRGLHEMARVSRRQVVFYFEPLQTHGFWALEYFPEALELPTEHDAPGEDVLRAALAVREVRRVLVPADCRDGFGAAFWARPEAYLDPAVQAGMSWLAMLPDGVRRRGTDHLRRDLASGEWDRRHGHLRRQSTYDGGYRIAIAGR
jgi:SAM-dependent methyltransferase